MVAGAARCARGRVSWILVGILIEIDICILHDERPICVAHSIGLDAMTMHVPVRSFRPLYVRKEA